MPVDNRFKTPGQERQYVIQSLWDKHHEMKRLVLLGLNNQEIAETMGCSPQNVSDIRNSPLFQREVEILRVARDATTIEVSQHISEIASKGLQLLNNIVDGKEAADIALRVNVIQDILDRHPKSAKIKSFQGSVDHSYHVTGDVLTRIKERAKAAQAEADKSSTVVDAEFTEVKKNEVI